MNWDQTFTQLFDQCLAKYQGGNRDFTRYYSGEDLEFLRSIGHKPREFFDFIEDFGDDRDPAPSTALLIAAVRRDYFQVVQNEVASQIEINTAQLPTFGDTLDGIAYLPRILKKARAKLRGELEPDLMFCCGGDRKFLRDHGNIHPADFLRQVWVAEDDDQRIADFVRRSTK